MHNQEIAWALSEMADLMDILGENTFKVRAYRKGALAIEGLETPAETLLARGQLAKIDGIGKGLCAEVEELLRDKETRLQRALREKVPPGVLEMLRLPGIGIWTVRTFFSEGITTLEELEEAARTRKIRHLPGLGSKTELAIIRGLDMLRRKAGKFSIGVAKPVAESFVDFLRNLPEVNRAELAGGVRRSQELIEEIHLLVTTEHPEAVLNLIKRHPSMTSLLEEGVNFIRFRLSFGLPVRIELIDEEQFISRWVEATGSPAHWAAIQFRCNDAQRVQSENWQQFAPSLEAEEGFYRSLNLPWIPPEIREDGKEVQLAVEGKLPRLVEINDIQGDLHIHTKWSDGVSTIEEMMNAGKERGYSYMAITDHSQSLNVARGLSEGRLREQQRVIRALSGREKDFTVFSGVEMDILTDARLDYPDDLLVDMDLVIGSVHTGLHQDRQKIHFRLEAALKNPHVDIIGHPTGRLLGARDPYDVDIEWLMELAAKTGTILEINASPDRLDLSSAHARLAKNYGIMIAINTDAHDRARLGEMAYGVANARKAGLEPEDILNTRSAQEVKEILVRPKG